MRTIVNPLEDSNLVSETIRTELQLLETEIASTTSGHNHDGTDSKLIEAVSMPSGIDAAKLADGSVTNTEFQYINTLTSNAQTQIDTKAPIASPTFTGTVTIPTPFTLGAVSVTPTGTELNFVDGVTSSIQTQLDGKVDENVAITGATKTKITYDAKGLITSGTDATTADIADSTDKRYCTDAQKTVISNTSNTNTGDETNATIKTKLGAATASVDGYATATQITKLDGIEAGADVTDATNVASAGALMVGGGTMTGDIQLGETDIKLDAVLSADEKWSGIVMGGTAGETLVVGDVCYLASTGKWLLNDGILDGTDTGFSKQLGICVLAGADTEPTEMLTYGKIRSAAFPAFTVGSPVYLDDTAGDLTVTQPTTTNFVIRVLGFAITAEDLLFNPSNDFIVHV